MANAHPRPLIILGGAGDLTGRLLLPALAAKDSADTRHVIGVASEPFDDQAYRRWALERLRRHAPGETHDGFLADAVYVCGDVTESGTLRRALERAAESTATPPAVYLALPNNIFAEVLEGLGEAGLPRRSLIAVEKPFGADRRDAERLNDLLHRLVPERATFRIDHFMAKRTVLNILGVRFGNRLFESLWNNQHIDKVEIIYDEALGLEGRAAYYDHAGALRDMLQNHLLQILALICMNPPRTLDASNLQSAKAEALGAVRTADPRTAVRGRYGPGRVDGRTIPAYIDEPGVDRDRGTETFAEFVAYVDNWRWAGVPFRLRTGKALGNPEQLVRIHFRPVPHSPFGGEPPQPNILSLDLSSDAMALDLEVNSEIDPFVLERRRLATAPNPAPLPAYATVLAAILEGDTTLSISDIEAEQSWRIVEDVVTEWRDSAGELGEYPAGSSGPPPPRCWVDHC